MKSLTIGKLADLTGTTADTLRYYERMGLIKADDRSKAGYRLYTPETVKVIRFIKGAKALNFTLAEIQQLLSLNTSDQASCADVVKVTEAKIQEAEEKIQELEAIKKVLSGLAKKCPKDSTSTSACPILDHIKTLAIIALIAVGVSISPAYAKPISYVGGTMVMQENDETGNTVSMDYTLTPNLAVGVYAKHERGEMDYDTIGPQANILVKRWNFPDGQANIFNMTGAGVSHFEGETEPSAWTGILADYETRRIFTSYEVRGMYAHDIETSLWQRARVGVAPYKGDYEDLHTWVMLQVDHHPAKEDNIVVTPLIRLFKDTTLIEAGYSSNHHAMINWVLQF